MHEKDDVLVKIAKEWYKQKKVVIPGVVYIVPIRNYLPTLKLR